MKIIFRFKIGRVNIPEWWVNIKRNDGSTCSGIYTYFEKDKGHYYDNLTRVREKGEMIHWLKYFLIGVEKTAEVAVNTLSEIVKMKQNMESNIHEKWGRRTRSALQLLKQLFIHPVITVKQAQQICNLSKKAAGELIDSFEKAGIIVEQTGQSRNRIFIFMSYLNLFETTSGV